MLVSSNSLNHDLDYAESDNSEEDIVAGLTNNSYLAESHKVRHCVQRHPPLGQYVLKIAKNRLDRMLYVGLTEDHKQSARMFTNMVGAQILSQSEALSSHVKQKASDMTELKTTEDEADESNQDQDSTSRVATGVPSPTNDETNFPTDDETTNQNMTVDTLMDVYGACTSNLRKSQAARRTMSFRHVSPANFSKEARLLVPEDVLREILVLNKLDVELYEHAQYIFQQQKQHLMQQKTLLDDVIDLDGCTPWKLYSLAVSSFLFLFLFLIVTARRRMRKVMV